MTKCQFHRHSRLDRESIYSYNGRIYDNIRFQISPFRIDCFYQLVLPFPIEMLYLLFSGNSLLDIRKRFKINKFITTIPAGENRTTSFGMLNHPTLQTIGYSDIQDLVCGCCHKVDISMFIHFNCVLDARSGPGMTLIKQQQA